MFNKKGERQTTGTHFLCLVSWRACCIVGRGALDVERMGGPGLRSPALFFLLGLRPKWLFGIPVMTAKMQPSFVPALDHPQFSLPVHNNIWFAQYNLFITCSSSPRSYEYIPWADFLSLWVLDRRYHLPVEGWPYKFELLCHLLPASQL